MADPTGEFSKVEESALDAAGESAIEPVEGQGERSDAAAEKAAGDKMAEIFGRNDAKNQADELEEEGITGPDNPDGDKTETDAAEASKEGKEEADGETEKEPLTEEQQAEADHAAKVKEVVDKFDPNLKRVASELGGWKKDEIEEFIASNPVMARITFSKMAAGYNALSLQYAQGVRGPNQGPQQPQQSVATQPNVSALDDLLANPEKLKALQEIAGDELTKLFIRPMLEERKAALEDRQFIASQRREALVREVDEAFGGIAKVGFEEFYGKPGELNQDQHNNRFKVGQLADQIRAGAQLQNVPMGVTEAVRRAHLIVTADQVKAQARKEVTAEVKKRSTQITARPTARKPKLASGPGKGDDAALAAVEAFWDERA